MVKKRRVKSRKKLTQEQALEKIGNIYMQIQNDSEALHYWRNKKELDRADKFILLARGFDTVKQWTEDLEESIEERQWKAREDYGRYVAKGVHRLPSGHYFVQDEGLKREAQRSKSMVSLADQIIDNARVNIEAAKLKAEYTGDGTVNSRFLVGDGSD